MALQQIIIIMTNKTFKISEISSRGLVLTFEVKNNLTANVISKSTDNKFQRN